MSFPEHSGEKTLKQILPPIVDEFALRINEDPRVLQDSNYARATAAELGINFRSYEGDTFGGISQNASIEFTHCAKDVANPNPTLMKRIAAAERGIRTLVLYSEVVPLTLMVKQPTLPLDNETAADAVNANFDFIETIVESGRSIGTHIVTNYIEGHRSVGIVRGDVGSIVQGRLTQVGGFRLGRFELSGDADIPKVIPKYLDVFMPELQKRYTSPDQRRINCPGHIYKDAATGRTQNRRIFDILLAHFRDEVYPQYLPMARAVLSLYDLRYEQ